MGLYKSQDQNIYPSLRGLAGLIAGSRQAITPLLWLVFSTALLGIVIYFIGKYRKYLQSSHIIMAALIITLLVTPYMRSYDFLLLLIPILFTLNRIMHNKGAFLNGSLIFMGWGIYSFGFVFLANQLGHDIWSVLFPITVLGVFLFTLSRDVRKEKGESLLV